MQGPLAELGNLTTSTALQRIKLHLNGNCLHKSSFCSLSPSEGLFSGWFLVLFLGFGGVFFWWLGFLMLPLVMPSLSLHPATTALTETLSIQRNISLWSVIYYQTIIQTDKLHPQPVGASHARKAVVQKRRNTLSTRCFLLTSGKSFPLLGLLLGLNPTAFVKTLE